MQGLEVQLLLSRAEEIVARRFEGDSPSKVGASAADSASSGAELQKLKNRMDGHMEQRNQASSLSDEFVKAQDAVMEMQAAMSDMKSLLAERLNEMEEIEGRLTWAQEETEVCKKRMPALEDDIDTLKNAEVQAAEKFHLLIEDLNRKKELVEESNKYFAQMFCGTFDTKTGAMAGTVPFFSEPESSASPAYRRWTAAGATESELAQNDSMSPEVTPGIKGLALPNDRKRKADHYWTLVWRAIRHGTFSKGKAIGLSTPQKLTPRQGARVPQIAEQMLMRGAHLSLIDAQHTINDLGTRVKSLSAELKWKRKMFLEADERVSAMRERYEKLRIELTALRQVVGTLSDGDSLDDLVAEIRFYKKERYQLYAKLYNNRPFVMPQVRRIYVDEEKKEETVRPTNSNELDRVKNKIAEAVKKSNTSPEGRGYQLQVVERQRKVIARLKNQIYRANSFIGKLQAKLESMECFSLAVFDDAESSRATQEDELARVVKEAQKMQERLLVKQAEERRMHAELLKRQEEENDELRADIERLESAWGGAKNDVERVRGERDQMKEELFSTKKQLDVASSSFQLDDLKDFDDTVETFRSSAPSKFLEEENNSSVCRIAEVAQRPVSNTLEYIFSTEWEIVMSLSIILRNMMKDSIRKTATSTIAVSDVQTKLRDLVSVLKKSCRRVVGCAAELVHCLETTQPEMHSEGTQTIGSLNFGRNRMEIVGDQKDDSSKSDAYNKFAQTNMTMVHTKWATSTTQTHNIPRDAATETDGEMLPSVSPRASEQKSDKVRRMEEALRGQIEEEKQQLADSKAYASQSKAQRNWQIERRCCLEQQRMEMEDFVAQVVSKVAAEAEVAAHRKHEDKEIQVNFKEKSRSSSKLRSSDQAAEAEPIGKSSEAAEGKPRTKKRDSLIVAPRDRLPSAHGEKDKLPRTRSMHDRDEQHVDDARSPDKQKQAVRKTSLTLPRKGTLTQRQPTSTAKAAAPEGRTFTELTLDATEVVEGEEGPAAPESRGESLSCTPSATTPTATSPMSLNQRRLTEVAGETSPTADASRRLSVVKKQSLRVTPSVSPAARSPAVTPAVTPLPAQSEASPRDSYDGDTVSVVDTITPTAVTPAMRPLVITVSRATSPVALVNEAAHASMPHVEKSDAACSPVLLQMIDISSDPMTPLSEDIHETTYQSCTPPLSKSVQTQTDGQEKTSVLPPEVVTAPTVAPPTKQAPTTKNCGVQVELLCDVLNAATQYSARTTPITTPFESMKRKGSVSRLASPHSSASAAALPKPKTPPVNDSRQASQEQRPFVETHAFEAQPMHRAQTFIDEKPPDDLPPMLPQRRQTFSDMSSSLQAIDKAEVRQLLSEASESFRAGSEMNLDDEPRLQALVEQFEKEKTLLILEFNMREQNLIRERDSAKALIESQKTGTADAKTRLEQLQVLATKNTSLQEDLQTARVQLSSLEEQLAEARNMNEALFEKLGNRNEDIAANSWSAGAKASTAAAQDRRIIDELKLFARGLEQQCERLRQQLETEREKVREIEGKARMENERLQLVKTMKARQRVEYNIYASKLKADTESAKQQVQKLRLDLAQVKTTIESRDKEMEHVKGSAERKVQAMQSVVQGVQKEKEELKRELDLARQKYTDATRKAYEELNRVKEERKSEFVRIGKDLASERRRVHNIMEHQASVHREAQRIIETKKHDEQNEQQRAEMIQQQVSQLTTKEKFAQTRVLRVHGALMEAAFAIKNSLQLPFVIHEPTDVSFAKHYFDAESYSPTSDEKLQRVHQIVLDVAAADCVLLKKIIDAIKEYKVKMDEKKMSRIRQAIIFGSDDEENTKGEESDDHVSPKGHGGYGLLSTLKTPKEWARDLASANQRSPRKVYTEEAPVIPVRKESPERHKSPQRSGESPQPRASPEPQQDAERDLLCIVKIGPYRSSPHRQPRSFEEIATEMRTAQEANKPTPFSAFLQVKGQRAVTPLPVLQGTHTQEIASLLRIEERPATTIPSAHGRSASLEVGSPRRVPAPGDRTHTVTSALPRKVGSSIGPLAAKYRRIIDERNEFVARFEK